jgi:hypothetical protein
MVSLNRYKLGEIMHMEGTGKLPIPYSTRRDKGKLL